MHTIIVAAFYHFFDFRDYATMRQPLLDEMHRLGIKGSLLIAAEGINGTLSGDREAMGRYLAHLKQYVTKGEFEHKESLYDRQPFQRAKVRLKKEVISLGETVSRAQTGHYVDAKDWNALIAAPDTVVIDARNDYEVHLGSLIEPSTPKPNPSRNSPPSYINISTRRSIRRLQPSAPAAYAARNSPVG